jgi:Regulator of volume decrease after cellular swelling
MYPYVDCQPHPVLGLRAVHTAVDKSAVSSLGALETAQACRRVIWVKDEKSAAATFRAISMHALSRDAEFYQKACIYCQLDQPEELASAGEDDNLCSQEVMLVPANESAGACTTHVHMHISGDGHN